MPFLFQNMLLWRGEEEAEERRVEALVDFVPSSGKKFSQKRKVVSEDDVCVIFSANKEEEN